MIISREFMSRKCEWQEDGEFEVVGVTDIEEMKRWKGEYRFHINVLVDNELYGLRVDTWGDIRWTLGGNYYIIKTAQELAEFKKVLESALLDDILNTEEA